MWFFIQRAAQKKTDVLQTSSDADDFPLVFAELFIERFCMTGGNSPIGYLKAYSTNLYLSADPSKVREALEEGQRRALGAGGLLVSPI